MGITITEILVNNTVSNTIDPIRVKFTSPAINWKIVTTKSSIYQSSFEIRLGRHQINWGTDNYQPDIYRYTSSSEIQQFRLNNKFIERGTTYYGQLQLTDSTGTKSDWITFAFFVNRLPSVTSASISPAAPSENDDLILSYSIPSDNDVSAKIKWFRNGVSYRQFDNFTKISREYLRYNDIWSAEITPSDSLENGPTYGTSSVTIQKLPPVASSLEILPKFANANDILEASYSITDQNTNNILLNDKSKIRWYVNDKLIEQANDSRFIRFQLKPDDVVYFTVIPGDGLFEGDIVASDPIYILDPDFRLSSLKIDGLEENISVRSVNPTIEWSVVEPYNRVSRFAQIFIGSVPGASNVYSTVVETFDEQFTVPDNVVKRGVDYYVTVWASDTNDNFRNPRTSHFRVAGSLWESEVSNSTGWSMEVSISVEGEGYQRLSIGDGSRFAEIRFYTTKIDVLFGGSEIESYDIDMTSYKNIIISGQNDDLKLFVANVLAVDGTGRFIQQTSEKFIEVGTKADSDCIGHLKRLNYTVEGFFNPATSGEYSNIVAQPFISFIGSSISSITEHEGDILVATTPRNVDTSSKIYKILETKSPITVATENIDQFDILLNGIAASPDEKFTWFPHTRGASSFTNYIVPTYDVNSVFLGGYTPAMDNWQLISTTPFEAVSYRPDGLVIDTTFSNTARIDTRTTYSTQNVAAIEIRYLWSSALYAVQPVTVAETSTNIIIVSSGSLGSDTLIILKAGKTVQEVCDIINAYEGGLIRYLIQATAINGTDDQSASLLSDIMGATSTYPFINLRGNFSIPDPYDSNPYSYTSGGKWFYTHRRPGTPWFDRVDNFKGYTIDIQMAVEATEDTDRPSNTDHPDGIGLYVNDGKYYESIYFLSQEIICSKTKQSFIYDTSTLNRYRITGKEGKLKIWGKKPNEADFEIIGEIALEENSTNAANAGRPAVCSDASGKMYAAWHDDGNNNRRQLFFAEFDPLSGWSPSELIVSDAFGANNPDIAIDSNGIVYVVFETQQSDRTDIAVIHRNDIGWSEPYYLTSNVGNSLRPRIAIDGRNNVHVVWEDTRLNESEIFYCHRNSANGQWESSAFGGTDIRLTDSPQGATAPAISARSSNVYVSWTSHRKEGTTQINMTMLPSTPSFQLAAGSSTSPPPSLQILLVSQIDGTRAGYSDLLVDLRGQVLVTWHDLVDQNYQVFGRFVSPRLIFSSDPVQITAGPFDARFPKSSLDVATGQIFVVFEKEQDEAFDPYDPYFGQQNISKADASLYISRWNAPQQRWESSNTYGGFDVRITTGGTRVSRRPAVPDAFYSSAMHILHESDIVSTPGEVLPNELAFTQIRDIIYDTTFQPVYTLVDFPYVDNDIDVSDGRPRKEIRFGDFSNTVSGRFVIGNVSYYLSDAIDPFYISLISSATTNIPSLPIQSVIGNNHGDAWLGTSKGLYFYRRSTNETFVLDAEEYGVTDISVRDIAIDGFGNIWLASDDGVFVSPDHAYFWKISDIDSATSLAFDLRNKAYIGSSSGMYVFSVEPLVADLKVTKENYSTERTLTASDIKLYTTSDGMPSNSIFVVRADANNVAWVGTGKGLVRFADGHISVFNMKNGMSSNKINDITIRNTGIRYVATTAGVDKMVGVSIERLDFDNINAPVSANIPIATGDVKIPQFNNVRSVLWKEPNILFIAAGYDIYQIVFTDEQFITQRAQISSFAPADYALIPLIPTRNDDLQTYRLVGIEDITLSESCIFEVYLNGNPLTSGFVFSPTNQVIRFNYPLLKSDIVQVSVRPDIELVNDFRQDKAAQLAEGNKVTLIEKVISSGGAIYAQTGGDINTIQINDQESNKPFDRIVLDATPPIGKIKIEDQIDQSHVLVSINKVKEGDEYLPFDATSGIDRMIISNFTNFTDDGEVPEVSVPFATSAIHDLGVIFDNVTRQYTFPLGSGRRIMMYVDTRTVPGASPIVTNSMKAGTASPAAVYSYDSVTQLWSRTAFLGESDNEDTVNFMIQFNNKLIVGTGRNNHLGKIFVSDDGLTFGSPLFVDGDHAYCATVLDGMVYIGTGGGSEGGRVYRFDGSSFSVAFSHISGAVYGLTAADGELYAATGGEGRVYRLDPKNATQQIVHVDYEPTLISITSGTVNDKNYVFVGGGTNATIKRSLMPDKAFVHSFKTIAAPVYSLKNVNDSICAAIGSTLYVLDGVWTAKYTHTEPIYDSSSGPSETIWFVSDGYVYKVDGTSIIRNVYLKLIDKAGNETKLFTDEAQTVLDPNLYDSISLEQLVGFTNSNRILDVDEYGNTVDRISGDDRFYSADKIDEETGIYYTEIFNGTNSIVSWDRVSWDATIPSNTSIKFYLRSGATRDAVLDAEFITVFDGSEQRSADISFMSGQYIQVKVVMTSRVRGVSPSLRKLIVRNIAGQSVHFFTTNFVLPSRVKSGLLTSYSKPFIPISADVIFGVNTNNSVDFAEYQIIDENRVFTTDDQQIGSNLRVGIRLITPTRGESISDVFGEYGPYSSPLFFNSVTWNYTNPVGAEALYNFKVTFYEDSAMTQEIFSLSSEDDINGFSFDGEAFSNTGALMEASADGSFSYTPPTDAPLICNTFYFVKIEVIDQSNVTTLVNDNHSFVQACGVTYVDTIDFSFTNESVSGYFHFRIRFYSDQERTNLAFTAFSGNDVTGWTVDDAAIPNDGELFAGGRTAIVGYAPDLSNFDADTIYYLSIDAFDGDNFILNSNSFTFKAKDFASATYCGVYNDVPVVKNFGVIFELDGGQMVTLQLENE